ncbi:MAG: PIN domain-containing protein [Acetobacteraceae bacterium]|nr:PIN domain-containing protein [Acetobacteraceae bacterium]
MRLAFDTNILAYAEGVNGPDKKGAVVSLISRLPPDSACIPVQVLGELFSVLVLKANRPPASARNAILSWRDAFPLLPTSPEVMVKATDLATDHRFGIWDAVILASASSAGCRLLLSEDMQDGFTWGGVTITNPLALEPHRLLRALLAQTP